MRFWLLCACAIPLLAAADQPRKNLQQTPIQIPQQPRVVLPGPPPTSVTLSPASATMLSIGWSPAAGATRYVISRTGAPDITIDANAGFLQNGRFGYGDVGRKPATLYTYSLTALFPLPTLPSRSAAVQILMPTAFAPANFHAAASGPNAMTLSWSPRPEANGGYRIVRNGGNLAAVSFDVSGASFVDTSAPVGAQYVICSLMKLATGELYAGEYSAPVGALSRPFNILALGDSVMWGQGLHEGDKFSSKTRDWIRSQLGGDVQLDVKAHSGATTYPDLGQLGLESRTYDGEVPSDYPTISGQLTRASTPGPSSRFPPDQVDLVLVDGCVNNIGIITILLPYPDDSQLQSDIQSLCGNGMSNILTSVVHAFPNADVIVTGYFRFISSQSDWRLLLPLFGLASNFVQPDGVSAALGELNPIELRMAARSDLFYQQSNTVLQQAVNFANANPLPGRTRFNQVRFSKLVPAPDNSYAAPHSWQWLMPSPPFYQDDVYSQRHAACDVAANGPSGDPTLDGGPKCYLASLGHPNVAGAQAYTDAIKAVANQFMPQWLAARLGTLTAAVDTIVVRAQPVADAPDGGSIAVTATDGASGTSLAGRVLFNNADAGALGAPVRYSFPAVNPTDLVAAVQVPGRNPRYFTIPVRTFSISITVANSAAVVMATDTVTGRGLNGTVTINANSPSAMTVPTGQPINFSLCAIPSGFHADHPLPGQPQCGGIVHVPYYPDVRY
jgi:hypothetical protein